MNNQSSLLDMPRSALPNRIPHLVNRHLEDNEPNYSFTTQRYLIQALVGGGTTYWYYTTLKLTPAQVTELFEADLACINVKVQAIALEWEDTF